MDQPKACGQLEVKTLSILIRLHSYRGEILNVADQACEGSQAGRIQGIEISGVDDSSVDVFFSGIVDASELSC